MSKLSLSFTAASLVPYVKKREFNIELKERMTESKKSRKVYIFYMLYIYIHIYIYTYTHTHIYI